MKAAILMAGTNRETAVAEPPRNSPTPPVSTPAPAGPASIGPASIGPVPLGPAQDGLPPSASPVTQVVPPAPPPPVPFQPPPRILPSRLREEREALPPPPPERSSLRLIIILVGALACLAGLGWGTATVFGIGPLKPSKGISAAAAGHIYVKMPAMEFAMPDGLRFRQLRVRLILEMPGDVDHAVIASYVPRIANTVTARMADVAAADLNGAEGAHVVKSLVAHAANRELRPLRVRKVLVQEMLMH